MAETLFEDVPELLLPRESGEVSVVRDAYLLVADGVVTSVGKREEAPRCERVVPLGGAVLPGFVDAHTHAVYGGRRAGELLARLEGEDYLSILSSGGGIHATVRATRAADGETLVSEAAARLRTMLAHGVTTVEVKTGYGLSAAEETRLLDCVVELGRVARQRVVPTLMAAHAVPRDASREDYLRAVVEEIVPQAAGRAKFCDVFVEEGAFTVDEAREVLEAARRCGMGLKVHAEELSSGGGAALAAEMGAVSADHLIHVSDASARALTEAGVVAVVLPATSFTMRAPFAPARAMRDAGVRVAVATDHNPGTSPTLSLPLTMAMAVFLCGLHPLEALWGGTLGGALALGLTDAGTLLPGRRADFVVMDDWRDLFYAYDGNPVRRVFVAGEEAYAGG